MMIMVNVSCKACGTSLEVPSELLGRQVECSECNNIFFALDSQSSRSGQSDQKNQRAESRSRQTQSQQTKNRSRSTAWLWVLFVGCGLIAFSCFGGCLGIMNGWSNPKLESFEEEEEKQFVALFPQQPFPIVRKNINGQDLKGLEAKRDFPEEVYFVEFTELEDNAGKKSAKDVLNDWMQQNEAKQMSFDPVVHQNFEAVQSTGQLNFLRGNYVVRSIKVGNRIYTIGITGSVMPGSEYVEKFMNGFQPKEKQLLKQQNKGD